MTEDRLPPVATRFARARGALFAAAILGATLVVCATAPWGSGLDNDVVDFFSAAESLLDGRGWVQSNGGPFALWPPLMPTLLAAGRLLGFELETTLLVLHPLAMFAVIGLSADLVRRVSGSTPAAVACALLLALAPVLHETMVMGLSEALFLAFSVAAASSLHAFLESRSRASFAACVVFTALTFLQRYLGVSLVMAICAVLLLAPREESWRRRVQRVFVFGALSTAPIVAWCLRTRALTGHMTGNRGTIPGPSLDVVLELTWNTFVRWVLPSDGVGSAASAATAALFAAIALALLVRWRRPEALAPHRWLPLAAFPLVYLAVSTYLNHRWEINGVGDRQLVPLAPFAAMFAALGLAALRARIESPAWRRGFDVLCVLGVAAHLGAATMTLSTKLAYWRNEGPGVYGTRAFRASEFSALLRDFELQGEIQSNDPHAVYYLTRRYTRFAPKRPSGFRKKGEGQAVRAFAPTLVWFEQNPRAILPIEHFGQAYAVEPVARARGGVVYRVEPR
jgi:hypothetical protein